MRLLKSRQGADGLEAGCCDGVQVSVPTLHQCVQLTENGVFVGGRAQLVVDLIHVELPAICSTLQVLGMATNSGATLGTCHDGGVVLREFLIVQPK